MRLALILPAAGASSRYSQAGGLRHKLDEDLGGRPVLQRTLELFIKHEAFGPLLTSLIVAGPNNPEAFADFQQRHADRLGLLGAKLVPGGRTHRYETVQAALAHVPSDATHIAIHDAARPCTPPDVLDRVLALAEKHDAVIPAIEVADTLKRAEASADAPREADPIDAILGLERASTPLRFVKETISRAGLWAIQTPQVFRADLLRRAYAQADLSSTDDAGLVERLGLPIVITEGDVRNLKVTTPTDLALARAILGVKPPEGRAVHKRF